MSSVCFICAQIIGVFIFVVNVIGDFQKKREKIFFYNSFINFLCAAQYLFLGALTGTICCLINILRNIVFKSYKEKVPFYVFLMYTLIVIITNIYFVHKLIDIVPIITVIIFSLSLTQQDVKKIKMVLIITGMLGILYDANEKAYVGILLNVIDFISGIVGTIGYIKNKHYDNKI